MSIKETRPVRSVPEWVGRTPDTPAPPRVRLRTWEREGGKCHLCTRKIPTGDAWILEHRVAIENGGQNSEGNLCLTCSFCKPKKDAEDAAIKTRIAAAAKRHALPTTPCHRWPKRRLNERRPSNTRDIHDDLREVE